MTTKKKIQTFYDHVNHCTDSVILLRHIAKMMAMEQPEYTKAFAAGELRDALAMEMVKYDTGHTGRNYEVTCTYCGWTESSTFRARKLAQPIDLVSDEMSLDDYMQKVVDPTSKDLAARIISNIDGPLSDTECDIRIGLCTLSTFEDQIGAALLDYYKQNKSTATYVHVVVHYGKSSEEYVCTQMSSDEFFLKDTDFFVEEVQKPQQRFIASALPKDTKEIRVEISQVD